MVLALGFIADLDFGCSTFTGRDCNVLARFMSNQSKIELESKAGALLRKMCEAGCVVLMDDVETHWLVKSGYAYCSTKNLLSPTAKGREYFAELCLNASTDASQVQWTEEARSGLAEKNGRAGHISVQTKIQNAAIPGTPKHYTKETPEQALQEIQSLEMARKKLAKDLDMTMDELAVKMDQGRIAECKGFDREPHVAEFHLDRNRRQNLCIKCKKNKKETK